MAANTDLTGDSISATYTQLLHIGDDDGIEATEHYVVDGNGTASALSLGTTAVGIGTESPDANAQLHIEGSGNDKLYIKNTSTQAKLWLEGYGVGNSNAEIVMIASTEESNMRGLGTYMLDPTGQTEWYMGRDWNGSDRFTIARSSGSSTHDAAPGTDFFQIDSSGNVEFKENVGIGTTPSSTVALYVEDSTTNYIAQIRNTHATDGHGLYIKAGDDANVNNLVLDDVSGNRLMTVVCDGNINIPGLTASSDVQTDGSKNLVSTSDSRLKNDLGEIAEGLSVIQNLTPRYFSWKNDENSTKQLGFFAQEVFEHLPESAPREEKMNLVSPEIQAQELAEWKEGELPTDENTKDEIKAFMDSYGFEYNSGDTKQDLLDKIPSVKQEAVEYQEAVYERALDDEGNPDWNWGFNGRPIIAMLVKAVQELSAKVEALENE
ncbi:MAG: tail fiber domain-containing protein [Nitrospinaceae bacterium]|jgi:hypothetical protein|nr:tail fiber domain-containing protein [Nitrospinaceae bacterium]